MKNKRKEIDRIIKELGRKGYDENLVERLEELEMEVATDEKGKK